MFLKSWLKFFFYNSFLDPRIARIAQSRSNQCILHHDCQNCRKVLNYGTTVYIGQNFFSQTGGSFSWNFIINFFLNETVNFKYGSLYIEG